MEYKSKLESVFEQIDKSEISFPKSLKNKKVSHISNSNVLAFISSISKGKKRKEVLDILSKEKMVQGFLNTYSTKECAFIISLNS